MALPATPLRTGMPSPWSGWFVDQHGHRLFLRRGEIAPICGFLGPAGTLWRLAVQIPEIRAT